MAATRLSDRAIVRLSPLDEVEDVAGFLQALVTNDVTGSLPVYAALLTAQGKTLFDFLVWRDGTDLLLECAAGEAEALAKRLSLYRLRRKIGIGLDSALSVHWSPSPPLPMGEGAPMGSGLYPSNAVSDPRLAALGYRWLALAGTEESADAAWLAHRLSQGVCEGQAELGEILWLETNAAELHGVSFTKGCYVGQENTARMNWRQKVNRRLAVVAIAHSDETRRRVAYPDLGLAVDHRRVEDIDPACAPGWMNL